MKHTYFSFCGNNRSKFFSGKRHIGFRSAHFVKGGGGKKEDVDEDEDEDEAKEELLRQVRAAAKDELKSDKNYKEFEKMSGEWKTMPLEAVRALCDDKTGVLARFAKIDEKMLEFETRAAAAGEKNLTLRGQIEKWAKDNKEALDSIRAKKKVAPEALELNMRAVEPPPPANSPMLPSNTYITGSVLPPVSWDYGVNDILRPQPTFWDYLTKGKTDSAAYGWVNKTNVLGAAGFIGPGVLKPKVSFQLETKVSTYRKVAVTAKVAQELLWDISGMETLIKDELRYQILIALNNALLSGAGSDTEPTGIRDLSVAYTLTGIKTTNPNYMDAIRAVVAQLRSGQLTGNITVFINPIDSANMDLSKATTSGTYLLPPFVTSSGRTIAGATIVEEPAIPVGYFQAGFLQYYRILIYKGLIMTFGWENDDFTRNLITYLAEMAIHQFFNEMYTGAFVYDSFANVLAAID